jgi:hypothetical protein
MNIFLEPIDNFCLLLEKINLFRFLLTDRMRRTESIAMNVSDYDAAVNKQIVLEQKRSRTIQSIGNEAELPENNNMHTMKGGHRFREGFHARSINLSVTDALHRGRPHLRLNLTR